MRSIRALAFCLSTACLTAFVAASMASVAHAQSVGVGLASSEAAARVDKLLSTELLSTAKNVAGRADDETFLRRVTLDLIGEPPSLNQMTAYALDPAKDKRAKVVNQLLSSEKFGENWAGYWRDVIMYRRTEDRALLSVAALNDYLTDALNKNVSWDKVATEFVTATGVVTEDGRTALIMAQMGEPEELAAEVSRIFLGIQIQCAQCHDHPTDKWKRQQFHEFAAFFPRIAVRQNMDGGRRTFEVVSVNREPRFAKAANRRGSAEHYMPDLQDPSAKGTLTHPKFFVGQKELAKEQDDQTRRATIAKWMTSPENQWFAKAFVNRTWSELVGEGFYEPVDDMGPERAPSAPKTIDFLSREFANNGYDVKWLFRTITATEAYQRGSRTRRNPDETPFAASCPQRLRADQLLSAVCTALGIEEPEGGLSMGRPGGGGYGRFTSARAQFTQTFGYDPSDPREEVAGAIPQALLMMNSAIVNGAINGATSRTALGKLLSETNDNAQVVKELYLRCLAREPSSRELAECLTHVKNASSRAAGMEDVLWVLVNSTEFLHRR